MEESSTLQLLFSEFVSCINGTEREGYGELPSDECIRKGVEPFLMHESNREAMQRLDYKVFHHDGFSIGNNKYDIKTVYHQHCSDETKFRLLWLTLVRLCNHILPASHQLTTQQKWLEGGGNGTAIQPCAGLTESISAMPPSISGPLAGLLEQLAGINPSQLIATLGSLVQPVLAGIEDPETKRCVSKIFEGFSDLASTQSKPHFPPP